MIPLRAWTEIDLSAYERNLKNIKNALPKHLEFVSVVKADAYGHGLPQIVERSLQSGIKAFAVANIHEAFEIRNIGVGWPILLLGALLPGEEHFIPNSDFIPTISSLEELHRLNTACEARNASVDIHLKVDTGMGRLGIWFENFADCFAEIQSMKWINLTGIYTHFSDPINDPKFTLLQRQRMQALLANHSLPKGLKIHADNSASFSDLCEYPDFNAVRIGLLQYGILPYEQCDLGNLNTSPTLSFYTKVGVVKKLPKGTSISYGRKYILQRDSKIAVLTAGYGDGIPIAYGDKGSVIIRDQLCPIIGQITMDQIIVDVSELDSISAGETVILIGSSKSQKISLEAFSKQSKTIPWEILCSITKRVNRVYINPRG
jgi:alanine racemase